MSMRVLFRLDASPLLGGGHAMRCLTLADALAGLGADCAFAVNAEALQVVPALARHPVRMAAEAEAQADVDLLVVDHYDLGQDFERACRRWARRIMVIDDLADRPHQCDVLLDQTFGRTAADYAALVPPHCQTLIGARYALLRPQFGQTRPASLRRRRQRLERVLVAMGSADAENVTTIALQGIAASPALAAALEVEVVLGAAAPHLDQIRALVGALPHARLHVQVDDMAALMAQADLVIGASGGSALERCALGVPSAAVVSSDNQRQVHRGMVAGGAAVSLGWWEELRPPQVTDALEQLAAAPSRLAAMAQAAAAVCDGGGALRVARLLAGLAADS